MINMLNVGDKAPDFLGFDENGTEIRVSDYKGRRLVVYFYPKDSTPGCTAEACSLRDGMDELVAAGYAVVLLLLKKAGRKSRIPFLPFLLLGYVTMRIFVNSL